MPATGGERIGVYAYRFGRRPRGPRAGRRAPLGRLNSFAAGTVAAAFGLGCALLIAAVLGHPVTSWASGEHRVVVAGVARDGLPTPTPRPTATPTPPPILERCYAPRAADPGFVLFPAKENSFFQSCQVVAYYGYPGSPVLGVLGELAYPDPLGEQLTSLAAAYDALNGPRHVVGGLHLIAAVAQADAGPDGTYLSRMPGELIEQYIRLAEERDFVVFLDLQIGQSDVVPEVERILPYLRHPRVHLALDPEWTMPPGVAPGDEIGTMDASEINAAQELLRTIVEETRVRSKMLVVHQFTASMITNKASIEDVAEVDLVIDMDGFGGHEIKLRHYQWYVVDDGAEHGGIKLFLDEDFDMFEPAEVQAIVPQPDYVQYQ
ncbi:MAG: hypothetical protein IT303_04750 [Dehalococcoidia bacterium]|nr:hypothetical protein [Dehalococcoidia bacterium]